MVIISIGIAIRYRTMSRTLIQPITSLKTATDELVEKLDSDEVFVSDIHTGDEIEALAHSFEEMDRNLKTTIRENLAITAERERLNTELGLARSIQMDMLPCIFPPFPERKEFDLFASMDPAKEVGGDFYDFFLIDDDHLGIVMADVSGKGVPAALFMMMAKILLYNYAMMGDTPHKVLERLNATICKNNDDSMFVTVWFGIYTISTGKVVAANAGHEYPIIKHGEKGFEIMKDRHGFVIGGMDGLKYRDYEFALGPGDVLFLYTDGVPEATDKNDNMYGLDRLLAVLNAHPDATAMELLQIVHADVENFVGSAPQFDDLTMLGLKRT